MAQYAFENDIDWEAIVQEFRDINYREPNDLDKGTLVIEVLYHKLCRIEIKLDEIIEK